MHNARHRGGGVFSREDIMTFLRKLALSASVIALGCSSAMAADLTVGFSQIGSDRKSVV